MDSCHEMEKEIIRLTEEEFVKVLEERGLDEWDLNVALGGFRKGTVLELDGRVKYAIRD